MKTLPVVALLCCLPLFNAAHAVAPAADSPSPRSSETHTRKPTLPVAVATELPSRIVAGESLTLDVGISSALGEGQLIVAFVPDDGLVLVSPQQEQQFTLSGETFKVSIPLTVLPAQDGRYAVTVAIRHVSSDGRIRSVARGITFRVGEPPAVAAKASAATENSENNVISLPAQETIIRH